MQRWRDWVTRALATSERPSLTQYRNKIIEIVRANGLRRLDEPVQLASGEFSSDFIDGKEALASGENLELAGKALLAVVHELEVDFDAVGGLTMGADPLAHVVAVLTGRKWFSVRKARKGRGTNKLIEGARIEPGVRVLLVDDVVTLGGSIREAYDAIRSSGASVVAAVTLVDRGETARPYFESEHVPYRALVTYHDLNIEPVGGRRISA